MPILASIGAMALDIRARPPYIVTPNTFSIAPSGSVTFNITTLTFCTGTLYWTISGTITAAEFNDSANSGSVSITSNSGSVTKTLTSDVGAKTIIFELRTGSTSGPIVATAAQLTVAVYPMNIFLLAGGGAGGYSNYNSGATYGTAGQYYQGGGGGGGGGGLWFGNVTLSAGVTYTATVGSGGAVTTAAAKGGNGNNSTLSGSGFTTKTAYGGGGGGSGTGVSADIQPGSNASLASASGGYACGGGGGSSGSPSNISGGSGTGTLGRNGGSGRSGNAGGGGGGLYSVGNNSYYSTSLGFTQTQGGFPGQGATDANIAAVIGASYNENLLTLTTTGYGVSTYGGYQVGAGGAGAPSDYGYTGAGGNSAEVYTAGGGINATAGNANMGTGGGGGVYKPSVGFAASGGSGVVIISMPTTTYNMLTTLTNVANTVVNGDNTILKWNATGTFRIS